MPVNGVEPVNIFVPLEPETYPVSDKLTALNVELSLVTEALKSVFKSSGTSANTTYLAVEGVAFAVKVSLIKVKEVLVTSCLDSTTMIVPEPPGIPIAPKGVFP